MSVDPAQEIASDDRVRLPITGVPGVVGAVASLVNATRIEVIGPAGKLQVSWVRAQTPFQPSKSEPSSGFAVSVIGLPKP